MSHAAVAAPLTRMRRLRLANQHTGETFDGPYRDAEGPLPDAMEDLAELFRDFHRDEIGPVDVGAVDFLADVMALTGQSRAVILSAYRTPETNAELARTHFGVAEHSQHITGHALDVTFENGLLPAKNAARQLRRGGVGWYPSSHFIHLDSGPVRNWDLDGSGFGALLGGRKPRAGAPVTSRLARLREMARRDLLRRSKKIG